MNRMRHYTVKNSNGSLYIMAVSKIDAVREAWEALGGAGDKPKHLWGVMPEGWTAERVLANANPDRSY